MKTNNLILIIASVLLLIGVIPNFITKTSPITNTDTVNVVAPTDPELKEACLEVTKILQSGKSSDALRLASLYSDMADLIALDGENEVIKTTEEIRQANRLSGLLLRLDLKGKYEGLAEAAKKVVVTSLGDDDVSLDKDLRDKAVVGFKALAWACKEGSK